MDIEEKPQYIDYVIANIKIPIMRKPNEEIEILSEFTTIDFEKIIYLPEKPNYRVNSNYIKEKVNEFCKKPEKTVKQEEIINIKDTEIQEEEVINKEGIKQEENIEISKEEIEERLISKFKNLVLNTINNKSENKIREPSPDFKIKRELKKEPKKELKKEPIKEPIKESKKEIIKELIKEPKKETIKEPVEKYVSKIKREKYSQEINNNLLNILDRHKKKSIS